MATLPQVIAANKTDVIYSEDEDPVERIRAEFEPQGMKVFSISAVSGKGLKELLYCVSELLDFYTMCVNCWMHCQKKRLYLSRNTIRTSIIQMTTFLIPLRSQKKRKTLTW